MGACNSQPAEKVSVRSFKDIHTISGKETEVTCMLNMKMDNDEVMICGCADGNVRIWGLKNEEPTETFLAHNSKITAIHGFKKEANTLLVATASVDRELKVWSVFADKGLDSPLSTHMSEHPITSIVSGLFNGETRFMTSCGNNNVTVHLDNDNTNDIKFNSSVNTLGLHLDKRVLIGLTTTHFVLWDSSKNERTEIKGEEAGDKINSICCFKSKNDNLILTGGNDKKVRLWNPSKSATLFEKEFKTEYNITSVAGFNSQTSDIVIAGGDRVEVFDSTRQGTPLQVIKDFRNPISNVDITSQGDRLLLIVGSKSPSVKVYEAQAQAQTQV
jgi:WD40 repeat protein